MAKILNSDPTLTKRIKEYVEPEIDGYKTAIASWLSNMGQPQEEKIKFSSTELTIEEIYAQIEKHFIDNYSLEIIMILLNNSK